MATTSRRSAGLSIGELAKRTGVPVKTLRFYSDEGLLPPAGRTASNYRLYAEEQIVRIDLIRTLREAGIGLEEIGKVLRRDMTLEDALRLRLRAIEAHVASLQRVAAALRAALRTEPQPTERDLRRISMVTRLSNEDRRKVIESFYDRVAEGVPIDKEWMKGMIDATAPSLPDDATAEQLDAWVELVQILEDPTFVASMRANAADFWNKDLDLVRFRETKGGAAKAAGEARARGLLPTSPEAGAIVDAFVRGMAEASAGGKPVATVDTDKLRREMKLKADPRAERYWQLVAIMKGQAAPAGVFDDMRWLADAIRHHIVTPAS